MGMCIIPGGELGPWGAIDIMESHQRSNFSCGMLKKMKKIVPVESKTFDIADE